MTDYKLVPIGPTPEMVEAAESAYMPFGDMELALKMAALAAPAVQGELVGWQFYKHGKWWNGDILTENQRKNIEKEGVRVRNVYAEPQLAEQQPAPDVSELVEALTMARETISFALRKNAPDHFTTDADIARHVDIQRIDSALADHRKGGWKKMTDLMREEFEAWATTFFDGATQEMLKDARCPEGTEAYIFEGNDNAGIYLTAAYLGWKAARDAAPDVQGEPGAWSGWGCQYPGKMPRLYGERRIAELNCDWENGDQVLHFTAAPQPTEQQPAPDVSALVEALVAILEHDSPINIVDTATATERDIFDIARAALAAHGEQGGEV